MPEKEPARRDRQPAQRTTRKASRVFTDAERSAMRERARELKAGATDEESDLLAKIAEMPEPDRAMAEWLHALIKSSAPGLAAKTWYGMPAYAKDGDIICHFQSAHRYKTRYSTLGFSENANLDEGGMWPVAYALKELTAAEEARIGELVKRAVS